MKTILKIPENIGQEIKNDFEKHDPNETILFLLTKKVESSAATIYIGKGLITLSEDEAKRTRTRVVPSEKFLKTLYSWMNKDKLFEQNYRIAIIHSHPFSSSEVRLSGIDWNSMETDGEIYNKVFPGNEFVSLVFDKNMSSFDGCVVFPSDIKPLDEITIIGKNFTKLLRKKGSVQNQEMYSRMLLVPGYNLDKFKNLRIGIVGMGGTGSSIFQTLLLLGIGENNETVISDYDKIEISNLSRIPFASPNEIGKLKVKVAKTYAKRIRRDRNITSFPLVCYDPEVQKSLACCDLLLGASDSELARYILTHISTNFLVPLIDMGAGVVACTIADKEIVMSGGQARLYIPGVNPCLLCNMGVDFSEVNKELASIFLNEKEKSLLKNSGYLQDLTGNNLPQPSVFNLNQHITTLATDMLISYILKGRTEDTIYFDLENLEIKKFQAKSQGLCPHCGTKEFLCQASFLKLDDLRRESGVMPAPFCNTQKSFVESQKLDDVLPVSKENQHAKSIS